MKTLLNVKVLDDYMLECLFDNGVTKIADIKPFLNAEAFLKLWEKRIFKRVAVNETYITWLNDEVDLSADTLWHIGVDIANACKITSTAVPN